MRRGDRLELAGVLAVCGAAAVGLWFGGCSDDGVSDSTPPAAIDDLKAVAISPGSVRLTWTAPGDDGRAGRALRYRTVYATNPHALDITNNFCAPGMLTIPDRIPKPGGEPETLLVTGLAHQQTYYFRVQTEDEALKRNASNQASVELVEPGTTHPGWVRLGGAFDGVVLKLGAVGGDLVAVGTFTKVGDLNTARVARWDGATWQAMDQGLPAVNASAAEGITGLTIRAVAEFQGRPALCGGLTRQSKKNGKQSFVFVALWNGAAWDSLDTREALGEANDLVAYNGALVVAGTFARIDTLKDAGGLARWDGAHWRLIGPAKTFVNAALTSLATDGGGLVVAGSFDTTAALRSRRVAYWNGLSWSAWGNRDPEGTLFATTFFDGTLMLGGAFGLRKMPPGGAADTLAGNVQRLHCSSATANALLVAGGKLLVGGNFNRAGTVPTLSITSWNGTAFSRFGNDDNLGVSALALYQQQITVASGFASPDGSTTAIHVAQWQEPGP